MRKILSVPLISLALLVQSVFSYAALAQRISATNQSATSSDVNFDPNRILEDDDIFDLAGMSFERLVQFLNGKGVLGTYRIPDIDGVPKTAAEIIWRVATSYKINPKYLLALLQKEQSLVDDPQPTQKQFDWATGYGICDACAKNDPNLQEFKGFAAQLEWAAKQHREKYLLQILGNGKTRTGQAPGKAMTIDRQIVTPVNNATAMLYSYTPHLHGNLNLWRIWRRWFGLQYPEGTVVVSKGTDKLYLIRNGQKRPFASLAVVQSMVDMDKVLTASETELSIYPEGIEITYPKFSLLRDSKERIWLLTGTGKRLIKTKQTFRKFGFNEDEILDVNDSDLIAYPTEDPITLKTEFPQGIVLRDKITKTYWYVEDHERQLLPNKIFLALYFTGRPVKVVPPNRLAKYKIGETYKLHDGELVRGDLDAAVFVVENGILRPIPNAAVFEEIGWKWKNVIMLPAAILQTYTVGEPWSIERQPQVAINL